MHLLAYVHSYLRKNTTIRWMALKRWCVQILTGLAFLHDNHIIHRDIKCDNIFINGATGDIRIGEHTHCNTYKQYITIDYAYRMGLFILSNFRELI